MGISSRCPPYRDVLMLPMEFIRLDQDWPNLDKNIEIAIELVRHHKALDGQTFNDDPN